MAEFNPKLRKTTKETRKDSQEAAFGKERICDAIAGKFWFFRL